jgi:predicted PurR-regulated permease PerM
LKQKQEKITPQIYAGTVIIALAVSVAIIWYSIDVFLLIFAGILLSIFLNSLGTILSKKLKFTYNLSVSLVVLSIIGILTIFTILLIPTISDQIEQLSIAIPKAWEQAVQNVKFFLKWHPLSSIIPSFQNWIPKNRNFFIQATNLFSTTFGAIGSFIIFLFIGIFLAYNPEVYKMGVLKLIPLRKRDRIAETMSKITEVLRWWLIGKLFSMTLVGILTSVGLWILGIPIAITLGIIAALLTFIPNIGPFLSAIPAILIATSQSFDSALYVVLLYTGIQILESYLITPVIQQKTVSLPPALIITSQLLMATLTGGLGLALATPLTATLIVLIRMLYVEDILNDYAKT